MPSTPTNLPPIDLKDYEVEDSVFRLIPPAVAAKYTVIAFAKEGKTLKLGVGEPEKLRPDVKAALEEFGRRRGLSLQLFAADPAVIRKLLVTLGDRKKELRYASPTPYVDLTREKIPLEILEKFPHEISDKYGMVVFGGSEKSIRVAAVSPQNPKVQEILRFVKERNAINIELFQTDAQSLKTALGQYSGMVLDQKSKQNFPVQPVIEEKEHQQEEKAPAATKTKEEPKEEAPEATEKLQAVAEDDQEKPITQPVVRKNDERYLNEFIGSPVTTVEQLEAIVKKGQVPMIVGAMIGLASAMRASDIHLEPMEKQFRLRYRVDGILRTVVLMPLSIHPPIISRIKILSEMKIDEQRVPQDGRYDVIIGEKAIDLRVSTLPTVHGEKIVIRLLDKSSGILSLTKLGLVGKAYERLIEEIHKPYGVVLSTGPTGSGKSTTLYAILHEIATPQVNVITLEDPVEYEISGINQSQVKPNIGFSFAEGLRSILRQDPNVVMVGETRDAETAGMVTHAALTGHLVLSTLHTNDAASALPRLINMGVEPFLITSAMNCVVGQRLVRKICPNCKQDAEVPAELKARIVNEIEKNPPLKEAIGNAPLKFFKGKGCKECTQGYQGRLGVYEVLTMTEPIEALALKNAPSSAIAEQARKEGMLTMFQDGIVKAVQGITTLDEVFRVTSTG